jgi:hypothetical protein
MCYLQSQEGKVRPVLCYTRLLKVMSGLQDPPSSNRDSEETTSET